MATDISKKDQLIAAVKKQNWKRALGIAKNFRREFNVADQAILQIAYECYNNIKRKVYYNRLGIDVDNGIKQAIELLKQYK